LKVGVDNPGDQLANVVGEKSSVKLGPLDVSLRPFVALVERFVPNQRLSSSLHRTGNRLTLLAQMPRMERNWRVVRDLPAVASEDEQARALTAMKEELVNRVCTAVVQTGSPRWEAVKRFSDGLREYRRTLSSDTGKELHLRHAEEGFRAARSIDRDFARCSYNLGVVYRQRGRIDSAKAAFERALEEDPAHADAAHALAAIYLAEGSSNPQKGAPARSLEFAERAIALAPRDIRGWNIKGNVWRRLQAAPDSGAAWRSCLSFHETAAALAWRALCGAARRGQPLDAASKALAIPFADLAYVHSQLGRRRRAARILRQAIWRQPDASLCFGLGTVLASGARSHSDLKAALAAFRGAAHRSRSRAERVSCHAWAAETLARMAVLNGGRENPELRSMALQAYEDALFSPSHLDQEAREKLSEACRRLGDAHREQIIERLTAVHDAIEPKHGEDPWSRLQRIRLAARASRSTLASIPEAAKVVVWTRAMFAIEIGAALQGINPGRTQRLLRHGVSQLIEHYQETLDSAQKALGEVLLDRSKFIEALNWAKVGSELNPFSAEAAYQLGLAHARLADYDQAERFLQRSLALDPSNVAALDNIGLASWSRGALSANRADRRSEFHKVIRTFTEAIEFAKDDNKRGWLHFWLGQFHDDVLEYESAAEHFAMAKALGAFSIECSLWLAILCIKQDSFSLAEAHLREAFAKIVEAGRQARKASSAGRRRRGGSAKLIVEWLQAPGYFSERLIPTGYFLLTINLYLAQVFAEGGRDIARARRRLRFVERHRNLLGARPKKADSDTYRAFVDQWRDIAARYEDFLGWVDFLDDRPRQARTHIETAIKIRVDPMSLCHLARVHLDHGATDQALDCCERARAADISGTWSARIARIETEAGRPRTSHPS